MSEVKFRYKAFISYSHTDREWAEWLLKALESYKVPKNLVGRVTDIGLVPARLAPIFRDRDELPAAHRLTDRLFQALHASEFLIVLCSPNSAQSKLVNREIIEFKRVHGDGHVLSIILDGVPFSDTPETECFPEALRHSFALDGRKAGLSAEGLAADVRPEGDGKRIALQKLVAGLLGVGLNEVVRRDEQRRQRRMVAALVASAIGMSVMGALTYEAYSAREQANLARQLAEEKQKEAEDQLRHNERLVHYVMTNMYERLLEHGNLNVLDDITKRILASFEERGLETLSTLQLFHYSGTMLRLGQNLDRQGYSDQAREIFDNVLKLSRRLHADRPNAFEAVFRLQNNLFFTGYLAKRQGRFNDAERDYEERLRINEDAYQRRSSLSTSEHDSFTLPAFWQVKLGDSKMSLASLLAGPLGQPEKAQVLHEESIEHYKVAVEARNGTKGIRTELASAYHYAGHTYLLLGQLQKAEHVFNARLAIFDELTEKEPNDYRIFRRQLLSKQNLALAAQIRGNWEAAHAFNIDAAEGFDRLVAKDPKNTMWLGDSAKAYIDLAETAYQAGNLGLSQEALEKGTAQIAEALARDNSRPKRRLTRYRAEILEAELAIAKGELSAAHEKLTQTLNSFDQEGANFLRTMGTTKYFAKAHLLAGELLVVRNSPFEAQKNTEKLVNILTSIPATLDLPTKASLATAHQILGQQKEALALLEELDSYGYRPASLLGQLDTP